MREEGLEAGLSSRSRAKRFGNGPTFAIETLHDVVAGVLVGVLAGVGSFVLMRSLSWATSLRLANGWLLWLLPLAGFVLGTINHRAAGTATRGTNFVLDEIYDPVDEGPPLRMTVLMLAFPAPTRADFGCCVLRR